MQRKIAALVDQWAVNVKNHEFANDVLPRLANKIREITPENCATVEEMFDAAIEAVEHMGTANWNSRESAAKIWLMMVKDGDRTTTLDDVQRSVNE